MIYDLDNSIMSMLSLLVLIATLWLGKTMSLILGNTH